MTKEEVIKTLDEYSSEFHLTLRHEDGNSPDWTERMARMELAIEHAISMLTNATIWTRCTERMPTVDDGNRNGNVNAMYADGSIGVKGVPFEMYGKKYDPIAWSRIEPIGGGNG